MSQSFDPLRFTFEQINVTDPMDTGRISFDPSQSFNPKQTKPEDNPYQLGIRESSASNGSDQD